MSNVTLEIAGRKFTVACAEGEEPHIQTLGRIIDTKVCDMPGLGTQSEARCLLYAALLLADENFELNQPTSAEAEPLPDIAGPLESLAERLEALASQLENG
jgi:cell division protein ZapA